MAVLLNQLQHNDNLEELRKDLRGGRALKIFNNVIKKTTHLLMSFT